MSTASIQSLPRTALAAAALVLCLAAGAEAAPEISVSRSEAYVGESVVLTVRVPNGGPDAEVDFSSVTNAAVRLLESRHESRMAWSFVNGRTVDQSFRGQVLTYALAATRPGTVSLRDLRVRSGSGAQALPGPTILVRDVPAQSAVRVSIESAPDCVLPDDTFTVTLRIRVRRLPEPFSEVEPFNPASPPVLSAGYLDGGEVEGLEVPDVRSALNGFLLRDPRAPGIAINGYTVSPDIFNFDFNSMFGAENPFEQRQARFALPRRVVEADGAAWFEYTVEFPFTARDEGVFTFGPALFKGDVIAGVTADNQPRVESVFAVGPACPVRVTPPPEKGRPASFSGATGTNATLEASLDAQTCRVGDPLKLTLSLAGDLSFQRAYPPGPESLTNLTGLFTVYGQSVDTVKDEGRRGYVYTVRPLRAGTFEVPPVEVAYFDTAARAYRVVRSLPIPIKVSPSAEVTADQVIGAAGPGAADEAGAAAAPVAAAGIMLDPAGACAAPPFGGLPVLGLLAAGPLVFLGALAWRGVRRLSRRAMPGRRRRRAVDEAVQSLGAAAGLGSPSAAGQAAWAALRCFLCEGMGLPGGIVPSEIDEALRNLGVDAATAAGLARAATEAFADGYGPADAPFRASPAELARLVRAAAAQAEAARGAKPAGRVS